MFAVTERLLLRPGWAEDAPALATAIAHESVAMKLARLPWPYSISDAAFWLNLPQDEKYPHFLMVLRTKGAPRIIGGVGLQDSDGETEIGYWLSPPYWGLGFATEAAQAVVNIARYSLKLPRLVSGHFVDNPASGHVLRKIGFRPTGRITARPCLARGHEVMTMDYVQEFGEAEAEPGNGMMERTLLAA